MTQKIYFLHLVFHFQTTLAFQLCVIIHDLYNDFSRRHLLVSRLFSNVPIVSEFEETDSSHTAEYFFLAPPGGREVVLCVSVMCMFVYVCVCSLMFTQSSLNLHSIFIQSLSSLSAVSQQSLSSLLTVFQLSFGCHLAVFQLSPSTLIALSLSQVSCSHLSHSLHYSHFIKPAEHKILCLVTKD